VYLTCFDSTVLPSDSNGVYIKAHGAEISDPDEIAHAIELVYSRKGKPKREVSEFLGDSPKRVYKAVPEKCWVNLNVDVKNDPENPKKEIRLL